LPAEKCSKCQAPAPDVRSAGTLAGLGWRMVLTQGPPNRAMPVAWLCPECAERETGSAPLSSGRSKG
jgi:hypothetical protein